MTEKEALRQGCHAKRNEYLQARAILTEAVRIAPAVDLSALERELSQAMLDYYAAHGALHGALQRRSTLH